MTVKELKEITHYNSWQNRNEWNDEEIQFILKKDCECEMCRESVFKLDDFPRVDIEKDELMCEQCELNHHFTICDCCEEHVPNENIEDFFFISTEIAEQNNMKFGIYKVLKRPFYVSCLVGGFQYFFEDSIELVKEIDINKESDCDIQGEFICSSCVKRFVE